MENGNRVQLRWLPDKKARSRGPRCATTMEDDRRRGVIESTRHGIVAIESPDRDREILENGWAGRRLGRT